MKTTQKTVIAALLAALVCVATMIIKVPSPLKGYLNLGDGFVLLCGWALSPAFGFAAAGIGSALADVFSGYAVYAAPTFVIKGLMALAAFYIFKSLKTVAGSIAARILSGALAEVIMISGYYVFEGFMYGFGPSAVNIPANAVQGVAGLILGCVLIQIVGRAKALKFE